MVSPFVTLSSFPSGRTGTHLKCALLNLAGTHIHMYCLGAGGFGAILCFVFLGWGYTLILTLPA